MPNGLLDFFADPVERANIRQGFMDAVNRGAVGAALGAPVDMVNSLLNLGKAGYGYVGNKTGLLSADQMPELINNPVGGSEYIGNQMQRFGVVSLNRNALAEGLAGFLPMSPSTSGKAVAAIGAGGMVPGMDLAATVFHGSPHKFDRFDSSKIGTGEGAQAYGHGLYLADSPQVAQGYQRGISRAQQLAGKSEVLDSIAGKPIAVFYEQLQRKADRLPPALAGVEYEKLAFLEDLMQQPSFSDAVKRIDNEAILPWAKALESKWQPAGSFYKVDLPDEHIARMLDWDKPLSQQVPEVQEMVRVAFPPTYINGRYVDPLNSQMSGRAMLDELGMIANKRGEPGFRQAEPMLRQAGIPGIRYLDGGSRGAGQGSSNYVVFPGNEGLLSILERNGQPLK
jgi:hypothetical protein